MVGQTIEQLGEEARQPAGEIAVEGAAQARTLGLAAEAASVAPTTPAWAALLDAAHRLDAAVLVCETRGRGTGTRGLGAARSVLLGSVSSGLVHNAELPVLVVPAET